MAHCDIGYCKSSYIVLLRRDEVGIPHLHALISPIWIPALGQLKSKEQN